jgi:hypothetical protein
MRKSNKLYVGAVLAIAVLMSIQAGAASLTNSFEKTYIAPTPQTNTLADHLISDDNPSGDDIHPKLILGSEGKMVCVYEQVLDTFTTTVPLKVSDDGGISWSLIYDYNYLDYVAEASGILQYPDIVYNSVQDVYFLAAIDPYAESFNNMMTFLPGDFNLEESTINGISGTESSNYEHCAVANTDNFFISLTTEDGYGMEHTFGLGYFLYPDYEHPSGMGGYYYDGQSEHVSGPASQLEMDSKSDRILIVAQTETDDGPKITIKSTVSDEAILTSGETQNGMDKWADIEQYPGEYISAGTDPDVSGSGTDVCVAYVDGGEIKCSYSSFSGSEYEPGFDWTTVTIDSGSAPSVYMSGSTVKCAYVKDGNVYQAVSEDKGATWGAPEQLNSVDGTAVDEPGAVDVTDIGVVWTDSRNGAKDIYTAGAADTPVLKIDSIAGGLGVSAVIENTGTEAATNVEWTITLGGTVFLGAETPGTIATLGPGDTETIKSGFPLGFGDIDISISASCAEGASASASAQGKLLLFFVTGL